MLLLSCGNTNDNQTAKLYKIAIAIDVYRSEDPKALFPTEIPILSKCGLPIDIVNEFKEVIKIETVNNDKFMIVRISDGAVLYKK